jgi:hypothetical protein
MSATSRFIPYSILQSPQHTVTTFLVKPTNVINFTGKHVLLKIFATIFAYSYGDCSLIQGVLGKETTTLTSTPGKEVSIDIVLGCGRDNSGIFNAHETGIIGLRRGSLSFVSQIASSFGSKSFSNCFTPYGTDPTIYSRQDEFWQWQSSFWQWCGVSTPLKDFFRSLSGRSEEAGSVGSHYGLEDLPWQLCYI